MSIFKRKKLIEQLVTVTIFVSLVPLLLMGMYFHYQNWVRARKQAETTLALQTRLLGNAISNHLLRDYAEKLTLSQIARKNRYRNNLLIGFRQVWQVSEVNAQNNTKKPILQLIYTSKNTHSVVISERDLQRLMKKSIHASGKVWINFFTSPDNYQSNYFLIMEHSFAANRSGLIGILPASQILRNVNLPAASILKGSRFGIVNTDGEYLPLLTDKLAAKNVQGASENLGNIPELSAAKITSQQRSNTDSKWFTKTTQINGWPLWIVGRVAKNSLFAPVWGFNMKTYFFLLFGILWAILGAIYFAKRITVPLQHFAKSATEIARGDFTQKIEIQSNDEIGRLAKIFNYMMVELRRLNEMNLNQIISERAKTRAVIKNIADGVIVADPKGKIIMLNAAIEEWFQIDERQVIGRPLEQVIPNKHLEDLMHEMAEELELRSFTREFSIKLPGQRKESFFQARSSWVNDHDGHKIAAVTILRDITREKEVDRMKTELVSLVAHELRSPLTSISGFAELLLDTPLNDESIHEYSKIIKQESDRLSDLVNKFLDLTRIEAGRMDFHPQLLSLNELIEGILYIASSHAQSKDIKLDVNLHEEMNPVLMDPKLMSEVILNLLSNAIKYSPPKTKIALNVREEANATIIEVIDQGYGIPEKYQGRIFDKFFRVKDEASQDEKGTGLGLSLVKEIVELHRGTIFVESEVGKGSTFRVILPPQRTADSGDGTEEQHNRMADHVIH